MMSKRFWKSVLLILILQDDVRHREQICLLY